MQNESAAILAEALTSTEVAVGDEYFRQLTSALAASMGAQYVFVAECASADRTQARTLAFWAQGEIAANVDFCATGGPCEQVLAGETRWFPERVLEEFPDNATLQAMAPESYLGLPLVGSAGQVIGHLAIMKNTPLREAEAILPELRLAAVRASLELERLKLAERAMEDQKLHALGVMAGGMAHEFNNLLTIILSRTILARDGVEPRSRADLHLQQASDASERAADIVEELLAFARKSRARAEDVDAGLETKRALELCAASTPNLIEVETEIGDQVGTVRMGRTQFQQIVINLFHNAVQAIGDAGGQVLVRLERSELDASEFVEKGGSPCVKLTVSDTGPGIDPGVREHIFDPFFTTKAPGVGTGLGLSVVHGIVRQAGGKIDVHPGLETGTVFSVYLPSRELRDSNPISETDSSESNPGDSAPLRVLLVDDDSAVVSVTAEMLSSMGHKVASAFGPEDAWLRFQKAPESFDVVVSDIVMPRMDGRALRERFQSLRPDLPVLLITGGLESLRDDESASVLAKPYSPQELDRAIRSAVASSPSTTHPAT